MLKNGDFIKIEYTGYDEKNNVFDSTEGEIAKSLHGKVGSLLIVYGKDSLIKGMGEALANMKKGDKVELSLSPDKAFGSRNKDMVRVMREKEFLNSEIDPHPGLMVTLDTDYGRLNGIIKSVSGGRVLVDFNHPLCDKNVRYSLTLVDIIIETNDKIKELLDDLKVIGSSELKGTDLELTISKKTEEYDVKKGYLEGMIKELIPEIKNISIKETD